MLFCFSTINWRTKILIERLTETEYEIILAVVFLLPGEVKESEKIMTEEKDEPDREHTKPTTDDKPAVAENEEKATEEKKPEATSDIAEKTTSE